MVAVAVAIFAPTLVFGRVDFDDLWLWADDSPLRSFASLSDVWFEFDAKARHPLGSEYLPVRDMVVMLDMGVWGDGERGPHLTQLVLYAVTVYGLGTLLVRWGFSRSVAWLGTLLFAVHPLHVESVAWLSERKGILAVLFVVATGHAWIRFRSNGRGWWLAAAAACAVAGVWSKAPALFGPAAFGLWDLLVLPRDRRRWFAIGVVNGAAALAAVPVVWIASHARIVDEAYNAQRGRLTSALGALGHYVQSFAEAKTPSIAYPIQTAGPSAVDLVVGAAAIAGSIAIVIWVRKRHVLALLGWAWIMFVPISHLIIAVHIPVADRFALLWSVAPCVGVAMVIDRLPALPRTALAGALVCVLGIVSVRAEGAWASTLELYKHAFATNPRDWKAVMNYADELVATGERTRALETLDAGLADLPGQGYLLADKARVLDLVGRSDEALVASADAAASGLSSVMAQHAERLQTHGRQAEALAWIEKSVARQPAIERYTRIEGTLLVELGRFAEAEPVLRKALALDPRPAVTHYLLAVALVRLGRGAEARLELDVAARDPGLAAQVAALRGP